MMAAVFATQAASTPTALGSVLGPHRVEVPAAGTVLAKMQVPVPAVPGTTVQNAGTSAPEATRMLAPVMDGAWGMEPAGAISP